MLNSLIQKGKQFLNILKFRQRKSLLSVIFVVAVVAVFVFLVGSDAHAETFLNFAAEVKNGMMNFVGSAFQWLASKFMMLAIFVLHFVIEIASYNNFINSGPVTLGWVLVRDMTNMFFVIILMLIAFSTVIGIEAYEWKKLLVKFVMAAILVNFSRVICGVIIDAAQVFMMTFISGVSATAGGNLTNMLGLDGMLSMNQKANPIAMAEPMNFMVSSIFSCIFAFTAMVVIGAYLVVLLARTVALWILIILSPLAFVLGVIPKFQSYSTTWWTEFTNNVIAGPVLAFFLWLSFAVAGGVNIHNEFSSPNSAYPIGDIQSEAEAVAAATGDASMNLNAIMEWDTMAGFIIACTLLLAGVKVTQKLSAAGVGALGAAAGAAMKFATVATGAAAVRWGAGAVAEGAKKVGKFAAMKAPLVGGEAWMRRGRAIKAGAELIGKGVQMKREAFTAGMLKKAAEVKGPAGVLAKAGAGVAGMFLATSKMKEKRVKYLEGAVESIDKEREESMGVGTRWEGLVAGKRFKAYELAKEKADLDKDIGLMIPLETLLRERGRTARADEVKAKRSQMEIDREVREAGSLEQLRKNIASGKGPKNFNLDDKLKVAQAQQVREEDLRLQKQTAEGEAKARALEDLGRHDEARLIVAATGSLNNKRLNELYANLDTNEKMVMYDNMLNKRDNIKNQLLAAEKAGNTDLANRLEGEFVLAIRSLHNFKTNTMSDEYVRKEVNERGLRVAGYSGTHGVADRKKEELSVLTGFDAADKKHQERISNLLHKMDQTPGMQEEYKRRNEAAGRVVAATGDIREAVIMDKGMVTDPATGRKKLKFGMWNNIGESDLHGNRRTAPANAFTVDAGSIGFWQKERASYTGLVDENVIFSGKDAEGNIQDLDSVQMKAMANNFGTTTALQMKKVLPKRVTDAWNEAAKSGRLSKTLAKKMIDELTSEMREEVQKNKFKDILREVVKKAGEEAAG